ncbi:glycerol kinase GlpK [Dongia soli]|uniref:Glycerol kinase n=1 Tax=Dongia soli TaxID=600628 RepID=A0ABU5EA15_9PROT|nr:glycerol kinase GlpK [Dongia soli]MDY0883183.1 glycerol kinase GlpK [Dongia soli]
MAAILTIDQGTTSTRAILFDRQGTIQAVAQRELPQIFPNDGWVEHDPQDIWSHTADLCREVTAKAKETVAAIGITNQRETAVVWDRRTGKPIHNAIVWQDRRGAPLCRQLIDRGLEPKIQAKTGLLIDSYFSATKIAWILENVPGAREAADAGDLMFGTIDCFLLYRLTGGKVHATDITNASRTMLYNIHDLRWDEELLDLFRIPASMLPEVRDNAGLFGQSEISAIGISLPISGMAGDQQAAVIGQACFKPGMIKSTYGTGCFALLNTGSKAVTSRNRLLTTIGYRLKGELAYAIEGSIFVAGAAVQWLRDGLKLIHQAGETEALARSIAGNNGVYLVPAFTGLGAPYWDPSARGALFGLTRDTGIAEVVRSALEAVCYQTRDLMEAMANDAGASDTGSGGGNADLSTRKLRVDGGMVKNDWVMQFLADILNMPVERPVVAETTALGAAICAGLGSGLFASLDEVAGTWQRDRLFQPRMPEVDREHLYKGWRAAVKRVQNSPT